LQNGNGRISTPMASQKLSIAPIETSRQNLSFFIGPDPRNDALDLNIEVSGPKNSPGQRPNGVLDPVHLLVSLIIFDLCSAQGPQSPCTAPGCSGSFRLGPGRGSLFPGDPPFGPKKKLIDSLGAPLDTSFAPKHAPRSLSGRPKNRSERKMKMLKFAQFFHQKMSPGELLQIQDPQKGPPLDLISFPEGALGGRRGAKRTSRDPPAPPRKSHRAQFRKNTVFSKKH